MQSKFKEMAIRVFKEDFGQSWTDEYDIDNTPEELMMLGNKPADYEDVPVEYDIIPNPDMSDYAMLADQMTLKLSSTQRLRGDCVLGFLTNAGTLFIASPGFHNHVMMPYPEVKNSAHLFLMPRNNVIGYVVGSTNKTIEQVKQDCLANDSIMALFKGKTPEFYTVPRQ